MSPGLKSWRRKAKVIRTEPAPSDTLHTKTWCEACRRMHEPEAHTSGDHAGAGQPDASQEGKP